MAHNAGMNPSPSHAELSREDLRRLIDRFYARVREDAILAPIFNSAIDDWPAHQALLLDFWAQVALGERAYRGNPMAAHRGKPIVAEHFGHWLALWRTTAREELGEAKAEVLYQYARRIAQSLQYGLGLSPGRRALPVIAEE